MSTAVPTSEGPEPGLMPLAFRDAVCQIAASVMLVTDRDVDAEPRGMVTSSGIPVSMDPPSMLVAVNRSAGLHPGAATHLARRSARRADADGVIARRSLHNFCGHW